MRSWPKLRKLSTPARALAANSIEKRRQRPPKSVQRGPVPLDLHPEQRAVPGSEQEGAEIGRPGFVVRPSQANDPFELRQLLREPRAQPRAKSVIVKGDLTRKIGNHAPAPPLSLGRRFRDPIEIG